MTLLVQPSVSPRHLTGQIIDIGPDRYQWVKLILTTGEECFCYPDTTGTVPVKLLPHGTCITVASVRPCSNPGPTKWTANALHIDLQTESAKAAIANLGDIRQVGSDESDPERQREQKRPSLTCRYSKMREQYILEIADRHGFQGRTRISDAVAHIVDAAIQHAIL